MIGEGGGMGGGWVTDLEMGGGGGRVVGVGRGVRMAVGNRRSNYIESK